MFNQVIGHQKNIELLQNILRTNKIAAAYLFAGPPNIGKEFVAINFAKALNCLEGSVRHFPYADACDKCLSCRKIDDGNHPDVRIIRPEGAWMKIDQIRLLQRQISRRPLEGRYKVYILTDVERMNLPAANSFLKTLEEPPGASVLILLTSNYNALLPTIRSRCQLIRFFPIPKTVLQNQLIEKLKVTETKAKQITLLSGGRVGKALELAKEEYIDAESTIPDILNRPQIIEIFKIAEELNNQPETLDILLTWLRDMLLVKQGCNIEFLTYPDKFNELTQLASGYSRIQIQDFMKTIMETKNLLQRNINSTLALEVMVLKMISP
ncbi:TPA: DNA polymerase III subunit delta' [Candidatus Poribacteria bacterium]|nr:DNA polymerase III subunit delta' [Candidatus Poribacteria bacterium]